MEEMFKGLSIFEFQKHFGDDKSCIDALVKLKWGKGYSCRYCNYTNYCTTRRYGERRCCSCKKPESATAQTLFHKLKFPIHKAFMMIYLISTTKKGISALELHRKMGVHKRTALLFKRKVMAAMASKRSYKMTGLVEINETVIRANHRKKGDKAKNNKKLVVVGIQRCGKGISRAYVRQIDNAGVKQLKPFFKDHINKMADIKTDGWRSYKALQKSYPGIFHVKSKGKKNFAVLNRFIRCLRAWLRGIFGKVRDLQSYVDEYVFKFNRHKMKGEIVDVVLGRMIDHPPRTYQQIFSVV